MDKTIIEDAKAAGLIKEITSIESLMLECPDYLDELIKFAKLREARKPISQSYPVALNNMSNSPEHVKAYIRDVMPDMSKQFAALMTSPNIDEIVSRFLSWKLPKDFNPDANINFYRQHEHDSPHYPVGTNLFTAEQAKEMFRNVLAGAHVELHTTPQQPQSVADALEEAAKIILERKQPPLYPNEFDGGLMCYNEGLDVAVQIIRALIKRNAEGGVE